MAQVVEHLLSKLKALSSISSTAKEKKRKKSKDLILPQRILLGQLKKSEQS
jgi:hypothetical protein